MSLTKPPIVGVREDAPWDGDPFDRQEHGDRLLALIRTLRDQSYVIALNGDWGTGKSVFLERLEKHFERSSPRIPFIRIDAWASDDADDPLVPFVSAIRARLDSARGAKSSKIRGAITDAASKLAVPTTAMLANFIAPGAGGAVSAAAKFGQTLIDWESQRASAAAQFRKALAEARDLLTRRSSTRPIVDPIVIAIDELDRCKPDFSVKALERIKHFFNVPGVVFVIATDRGNLPAAVQSVYGPSIDGELYLRKFFDYEYHLPPPPAAKYIDVLWKEFGLPSYLDEDMSAEDLGRAFHEYGTYPSVLKDHRDALDAYEYKLYFSTFARLLNLQLRDQAQAFTMLAAHIRTTPSKYVRQPVIDCFCVCMRYSDPVLFRDLQRGRLDLKSIAIGDRNEQLRASPGLRNILVQPDGKALTQFIGNTHHGQIFTSLENEITSARARNDQYSVPAMARMLARLRLNRVSPDAYIRDLLWLAHAIDPA